MCASSVKSRPVTTNHEAWSCGGLLVKVGRVGGGREPYLDVDDAVGVLGVHPVGQVCGELTWALLLASDAVGMKGTRTLRYPCKSTCASTRSHIIFLRRRFQHKLHLQHSRQPSPCDVVHALVDRGRAIVPTARNGSFDLQEPRQALRALELCSYVPGRYHPARRRAAPGLYSYSPPTDRPPTPAPALHARPPPKPSATRASHRASCNFNLRRSGLPRVVRGSQVPSSRLPHTNTESPPRPSAIAAK